MHVSSPTSSSPQVERPEYREARAHSRRIALWHARNPSGPRWREEPGRLGGVAAAIRFNSSRRIGCRVGLILPFVRPMTQFKYIKPECMKVRPTSTRKVVWNLFAFLVNDDLGMVQVPQGLV